MSGVSTDLGLGNDTWPGTGFPGQDNLGNDSIFGNEGNDSIDVGNGNDSIDGGNGNDTIEGGIGSDTIFGGAGNDRITEGSSTIAGSNLVYAGIGNDNVQIESGSYTVYGEDGDDELYSLTNASVALMDGGTGNDALAAVSGDGNTQLGGAGNDTLYTALGNDSLDGGGDFDIVAYDFATRAVSVNLGNAGGQQTSGGGGNDTLINIEGVLGTNFSDTLIGDTNANLLNGSRGNDSILGGDGNDTVIGGEGTDTLDGGGGTADLASYANVSGTINASLITGVAQGAGLFGAGSDQLFGIEGLIGTNSNDTLVGNSAVNTLMGGGGSDSLSGGGGNDLLDFGAGNDQFQWVQGVTTGSLTLIGGDAGNDFLNLGGGWGVGPGTGNDWINYQRTVGPETVTMFTQGWESIVCFAEGTRIVTPSGEDAVENLRAGDMVLAMRDGQAGFEPLRWVGFMDVAVPRNATMAAKTAPILIKVGAIAASMPARDLRVSPDHAMEVDGHLIPAKHLVNGSSIIQETWCRRVRYFHLELEAHGLLLSEGTWSESYLDDGNRHAFNNAAMTGLFLDFEAGRSKGQYDHQACLPVLRQGLKLDEIHGRLALRADELAQPEKGRRRG